MTFLFNASNIYTSGWFFISPGFVLGRVVLSGPFNLGGRKVVLYQIRGVVGGLNGWRFDNRWRRSGVGDLLSYRPVESIVSGLCS